MPAAAGKLSNGRAFKSVVDKFFMTMARVSVSSRASISRNAAAGKRQEDCANRPARGLCAVIAITEKLLSTAGGWQAMKVGRELLKAGRVVAANYEPPLLTGEVREGQKIYRAGLRVRTATDVENICTCREARQWGAVCAGDEPKLNSPRIPAGR